MSRLRRLVLSDRYFFVTCRLLAPRCSLDKTDFECHARVIAKRRTQHRYVLTAWVFLPDHWHAIFFPESPLTIALVMECIKVSSTSRINAVRHERGKLWQPRYPSARLRAGFDRALRTVRELPGEGGLHRSKLSPCGRAPESIRELCGHRASVHPILSIDRVVLPSDEQARI